MLTYIDICSHERSYIFDFIFSLGDVHNDPMETDEESSQLSRIESIRLQERRDRLKRLARINSFRCTASPLYAMDLIQVCDITQHPSLVCSSSRGNSSLFNSGKGYFHCLHNQKQNRRTKDHFFYSNSLSNILKTPQDLIDEYSEILKRYVFLVPKVSTPIIQMHTSHPAPHKVMQKNNFLQDLHQNLSPRCDLLHPIISNMRTQFPELRLIQYDCGKLQKLDKLLYHLKQGGHRVLIFTQMSRMLDIFEQFLNYHGHTYLRLDGSTKIEHRQALMERFNADKRIFCFILSTRSGGIGVNLTGADTVIFYDSDWNPSMDAQAQDRCHRIGQTRDVHIYRLISERTVEENILQKARQKRLLGDVAIEGGNFTTAFFKKEAIKELFGIDEHGEKLKEKEPIKPTPTLASVAPSPVNSSSEEVDPNNQVLKQLEQALCTAEEDTDVDAAKTAHAEAAAELAEFDESIPLEPDSKDQDEKSPAEDEIDHLIEQVS